MKTTLALIGTAFAELRAKRGAFIFEICVMVVNNLVWLAFWSIFFGKAGHVGGWQSHDVYTLLSVVCFVYGIANGLCPNASRVAQLALDGELDSALALPADTLTYLLFRKVSAFSVGDLVFGVTLFLITGHPTPARLLLFFTCTALGAIVLVSFLVILGAASIAAGAGHRQTRLGFDAMSTLAFYPISLFGLPMKVVLTFIIPAMFVTGIPANVIRHFSSTDFVALVIAAAFFASVARVSFRGALRKYRSGSRWTTA
jgi:ABC-2 type transport system permease protein